MKTTTMPSQHPMTMSPVRSALLLIPLALACLAFLPQAQGQISPAPDGCYSNFTTAEGCNALFGLTTGAANTGLGWRSLFLNTTGSFNTGVGGGALALNNGDSNTAVGAAALLLNTTGTKNTATGTQALAFNDIGNFNTATGAFTLSSNTEGYGNTANGDQALQSNTTGFHNTGIGMGALQFNTTGNSNIALGNNAGSNLTTGINNIDIGNQGVADESKAIRIGEQGTQIATYIAAISGTIVPGGVPVIIDTTGHLGTTTSSGRFKDDVKPMDQASEALFALKPVTFRYKRDLDPDAIPQFGLVAEEVEKVNPDLVAHDDQGKPYTVRYDAVNAMLLNEFLKEHREVQEQKATIAEFKKEIANLTETVKRQSLHIQKVSAQGELSKAAPQTVNNP
jgi:hypothetical protein